MPDLTGFHDVRFPVGIALGSSGGPERNTEIVTLGSGREHRNQRWAHSRRRYEAGYGVKTLDELHEVIAFYEARRGPLHAFRFRDPLDWKSCAPLVQPHATDQQIGIGDGSNDTFALAKTYGDGEGAYFRKIDWPVFASVTVAVDGQIQIEGTSFTLDENTAGVVFESTHIPPAGAIVTAGYEFDVPVRFVSDQLSISLAAFNAGDVPSIPLVEVKL